MKANKGKKAGTFVVHIDYCENSTWQGEVLWAEQNERQKFRSTLELLKLIDSALEGETEKKYQTEKTTDERITDQNT